MIEKEDEIIGDDYWHGVFIKFFYGCFEELKNEIENDTIGSQEYIFYKTTIINTFNYLESKKKVKGG